MPRPVGVLHLEVGMMRNSVGLAWLTLLLIGACSFGQVPADKVRDLVPQNLLRLVHAPEVHRELALSPAQVKNLEAFFEQIDGIWFRSRIQSPDKQRAIIADLENRLRGWLAKNTSEPQRQRLQEIEYRSLGTRMLLRSDLANKMGLDESQQAEFAALARASHDAAASFQKAVMAGEVSEDVKQAAVKASQAEQAAVNTVLRAEQQQVLAKVLGEPFDTAKLERIYPMAPEFVPVENWINTSPLKLTDLRGKVVVVHFYAFQCHNCHANFAHYNKWHEDFSTDQVAVIGIQTPETSSEHDPNAVRSAAKEKGFKFPVLIDLKSANWKSWANTMWPSVYVIDKQGYIRYIWQGELNWNGATQDQTIHELIEKLIAEESATS